MGKIWRFRKKSCIKNKRKISKWNLSFVFYSFCNKIVKNLKNKKESFTTIYWQKPEDRNHQYKKITFNKIFEPYNFIIGTGEYLNDFENITKEESVWQQ